MLPASRLGRETIHLVIGASRLDWGRRSGGRWTQWGSVQMDVDPADGSRSRSDLLDSALGRARLALQPSSSDVAERASARSRDLRVVISDVWLPECVVPWDDAMRVADEAERLARDELTAGGHGLDPGDLVIVDDAPRRLPRLAISFPGPLLISIRAMSEALSAKLVSVLPLSAVAWQCRRPGPALALDALAVLEDGAWMIICGRERISAASARRASPDLSCAECSELVRSNWRRAVARDVRLASIDPLRVVWLKTGHSADPRPEQERPTLLQVHIPGDSALPAALRLAPASSGRPSPLDACRPVAALSGSRLAVAIMAILVAGGAAYHAWLGNEETRRISRRLESQAVATLDPRGVERWTSSDLTRVRAVNAAIAQLNVPAFALLGALIPPRDLPVYVLTADISAESPAGGTTVVSRVKITAEAASVEDMTRYVSFVSDRKPFVAAYLVHHELLESGATLPYRFTVEATWPQ